MNFESKSERQIVEESLFEKGEYDATVIKAEDKVSKKGNDMIALGLKVYHDDGRTTLVNDWLLPSMPMKLLKFCQSAGLQDRYDKGDLRAADCMDRDVRVILKVQEDESGQFPPQNSVANYKPRGDEAPQEKPPISETAVFDPADVPF